MAVWIGELHVFEALQSVVPPILEAEFYEALFIAPLGDRNVESGQFKTDGMTYYNFL
jgi:hypothetical protein